MTAVFMAEGLLDLMHLTQDGAKRAGLFAWASRTLNGEKLSPYEGLVQLNRLVEWERVDFEKHPLSKLLKL